MTPSQLDGMTVRELRTKARQDATGVLEVHWPDRRIPVDPVAIARSLGVSVFTAELGEDVYGMIQGDPAGANIYVDRDSAPVRQRFTVAHEVGHLVSHQDELLSQQTAFVDARSTAGIGTVGEVYANEFAAELLMPSDSLRDAIAGGLTETVRLAARFDVSLQAMAYRRGLLRI